MHPILESAENAILAGEPGRAVSLVGEAIRDDAPLLPTLHLTARACAQVLRQTGILGEGYTRGTTPPRLMSESDAGSATRFLVESLQQALYALAGHGESQARRDVFELADALMDLDYVREPTSSASPSGLVISLLCCERLPLLECTIGDLLRSEIPPADIVFFEDASVDRRILQHLMNVESGKHRIHIIANRGFSTRSWPANQNAVLAFIEHRLGGFDNFVTCDTDLALAPDWWTAIRKMERDLAPRMLEEGRLGVLSGFHSESSHPALRTIEVGEARYRIKESIGGCHIVVPRAVYQKALGPLDHLSDWGWSSRLRAAGMYVAATSPSRVQHLGEESLLFHPEVDRAHDFDAAPQGEKSA